MLAVATYIEEVKPGWREFDKCILENLQYTFKYDLHYYIGRTARDREWFFSQKGFLGEHAYTEDVSSIGSSAALSDVELVNVQPANVFKKLGYDYCSLDLFQHPDNCCYLFGPNHGEIKPIADVNAWNVSIGLERSTLYTSSAVAMVLYDRGSEIWRGL